MKKSNSTKATAAILAIILSAAFSIGTVSSTEAWGLKSAYNGVKNGVKKVGSTAKKGAKKVSKGVKKITTNLIFGSICIYLLIGLQWAFIYSLLENIYPGSFQSDLNEFSTAGGLPEQLSIRFFYFSYTTLSTLGYGDIIPVTPPAQMISAMEALAGQFYLAVLVARLVGLYLVGAKTASINSDRQVSTTRYDQEGG